MDSAPVPTPVPPAPPPVLQPGMSPQPTPAPAAPTVPPVPAQQQQAEQTVLNAAVQGAAQAALQTSGPSSSRRPEVVTPTIETPARPEPTTEALLHAMDAEPRVEISPEVEKYVEEVKKHELTPPTEVVVTDRQPDNLPTTVAQPVVILPATAKTMRQGKAKSPDTSMRWLVTWCQRQIQKFSDILVLYRDKP